MRVRQWFIEKKERRIGESIGLVMLWLGESVMENVDKSRAEAASSSDWRSDEGCRDMQAAGQFPREP